MTARQAEVLAGEITGMDRPSLIRTLRGLECNFDMDFSDEALAEMAMDRLRHIVLAAALRAHEPTDPTS